MTDFRYEKLRCVDQRDMFGRLIKDFQDRLSLKTFEKGEVFIDLNNADDGEFFIVKSGIARIFIIDKNGREFTHSFFTENFPITPLRTFIKTTTCTIKCDCLTSCQMYVGNYNSFIELTKKDIHMANIYNRMLEMSMLRLQERVVDLTLNAEQKYLRLKALIPGVENLIPQYQIAAYLNITNVQLSRIRKKLLYK